MSCTKFDPITASCAPSCGVCSRHGECDMEKYQGMSREELIAEAKSLIMRMTDEQCEQVLREVL